MKPPTNPTVTPERIRAALDDILASPGFCSSCGETVHYLEPDATRYPCQACGEPEAYGVEVWALFSDLRW